MSFIGTENTGKPYQPGYFLAHEECTRETRQIAQNHANVQNVDGGLFVPMGSAFPSNDANAIGIIYEDVDVTYGDMPGSVVTAGTVYEDRLAKTSVSYSAVTPATGANPKAEGWYERSGTSPNYTYTLTTDTTVGSGKTYYEQVAVRLASAAKTALAALGFKFIAAAPSVTRPY